MRGLPGRPPSSAAGGEVRRASDPVRPMGRPPRPLVPPGGAPRRRASARRHPNQEVVLDELSEDQYVEDRLVIPDEMVNYLQQVRELVVLGRTGDFSPCILQKLEAKIRETPFLFVECL